MRNCQKKNRAVVVAAVVIAVAVAAAAGDFNAPATTNRLFLKVLYSI